MYLNWQHNTLTGEIYCSSSPSKDKTGDGWENISFEEYEKYLRAITNEQNRKRFKYL